MTLEELLEAVKKLPPMTAEQKREQAISWVYGNLKASTNHGSVTREMVAEAYDKAHPRNHPACASDCRGGGCNGGCRT